MLDTPNSLSLAMPFVWSLSFLGGMLCIAILFTLLSFALHLRNEKKSQAWRYRENRWNPLLAKVYTQQSPPEMLWKAVQPDEELCFLDYLTQQVNSNSYLWRWSEHYQKISVLSAPYLHHIHPHLEHPNAFKRARAVDTLGKLSPELHRPLLHKALADKDKQVAFVAFRSLIYHASQEDCHLLMAHYGQFSYFQPSYISLLLSHLPQHIAAVPLISKVLQHKHSQWERIVALQTLEHYPPMLEHAGPLAALAMSKEEKDPLIKGLLLRLLLHWQADDVLKEVIMDFAGDEEDYLRAHAMFALGQYPFAHHQDLLELGLEDASRWVSLEAAQSLAYLEAPHAAHTTQASHPHKSRELSHSLLTYSQYHSQDEVFV